MDPVNPGLRSASLVGGPSAWALLLRPCGAGNPYALCSAEHMGKNLLNEEGSLAIGARAPGGTCGVGIWPRRMARMVMPRWATPRPDTTPVRPGTGGATGIRRGAWLPALPRPVELVAWASCPGGMARMAMPRWGTPRRAHSEGRACACPLPSSAPSPFPRHSPASSIGGPACELDVFFLQGVRPATPTVGCSRQSAGD